MIPETMDAWFRADYGPADGTRRVRVPVPQPGRRQVLAVRATALSAGDAHLMDGEPRLVRLFFGIRRLGIRRPRQPIRGIDVAGTIIAVGADVEGARIGEEVVVELPAGGGLAEYALAPAARLAARPAEVEPASAANSEDLPAGYDAILAIAGKRALKALLAESVVVAVIGGEGGRVLGPIPRMLQAALLSIGSRRSIRPLTATAKPAITAELLALVEAGASSR